MSPGMEWTWAWSLAVLVVAVGGAVGAVLRHLVALPPLGPLRGVLLVNVLGSAALGALVALEDRLSTAVFLLLATGVCGALTTWSTLAVHTWELGRHGLRPAAAYLGATLVLGLGAATLTYLLLA